MDTRKRYLLIAVAVVLIAVGAWFMRTIIVYILVALLISLMASPVNHFFRRRRIFKFSVPRSLSALLALFTVYLVLLGLIAVFIPLVNEESRIISGTSPAQLIANLHEPMARIDALINRYWPQPFSTEKYLASTLPELLSSTRLNAIANSLVGITGGIFVAFFAISFLTFFFLKDGQLIFETLMLLSPPSHESRIREIITNCKRLLRKYFTGLLLDSLCVTVIITLGLSVLGIPNAVIIGLFAGLVNIIPYVGPLIGAAFGLLVALSTGIGPGMFLFPTIAKVLLVFVSNNLIDGLILQPLIFSNTVRAHPLEIFLVILTTGTVAGIGAMVLAVPAYTVLRVIAKQFLGKYRIVRKMTATLDN